MPRKYRENLGWRKLTFEECQRRLGDNLILLEQKVIDDFGSLVQCRKCGNKYRTSLRAAFQVRKCRICEVVQSGGKKYTQERVQYQLNKVRLNLLSKYEGGTKHIWVQCQDCGCKFIARATQAMLACNEAVCYCKRETMFKPKRTHKQVIEQFLKRGIEIEMALEGRRRVGQRRDYRRKMKCLQCGHVWREHPHNAMRRKVICRSDECRKNMPFGYSIGKYPLEPLPQLTEQEELARIDAGLNETWESEGWEDGKYISEKIEQEICKNVNIR